MSVGVFIGRCQPLHDGHRYILNQMKNEVDQIVVLLGSANSYSTVKNPFSYSERKQAIQSEYPNAIVCPLNDYLYDDDRWLAIVKSILHTLGECDNVTLYGHTKQGNDYLSWFPEYPYVEVTSNIEVTATTIRQSLFEMGQMPAGAQADFDFFVRERQLFKSYPFPETLQFNCADALVVRKHQYDFMLYAEVLLVKRKFAPGAGTWAIPGGFRNNNEDYQQCALRELQEETGITLTGLDEFEIESKMFDSPKRAQGGILRNTVCFVLKAKDVKYDPCINAADDASEVRWFTVNDALNYIDMFHDHRDIISVMLNEYAKPAHRTCTHS